MGSGTERLRQRLRRFTANVDDLDADELLEAQGRCGAEPASTCVRGQKATLSGRLTTVSFTPRDGLPTVEAELFSGDGTVKLVWLGRRRIVGVDPGRFVIVHGRIARRGNDKVIYNPQYTLDRQAP